MKTNNKYIETRLKNDYAEIQLGVDSESEFIVLSYGTNTKIIRNAHLYELIQNNLIDEKTKIEFANLKEDNDALETELEILQEENCTLEYQNKQLVSKVEDLEDITNIENLRRRVEELEYINTKWRDKFKELERSGLIKMEYVYD